MLIREYQTSLLPPLRATHTVAGLELRQGLEAQLLRSIVDPKPRFRPQEMLIAGRGH